MVYDFCVILLQIFKTIIFFLNTNNKSIFHRICNFFLFRLMSLQMETNLCKEITECSQKLVRKTFPKSFCDKNSGFSSFESVFSALSLYFVWIRLCGGGPPHLRVGLLVESFTDEVTCLH